MYCRNCGFKNDDGANFCQFCGAPMNDDFNKETIPVKKVTFKDGIKALFEKIFLFDGKSSRAEFNFGLLFLVLVGFAISLIVSLGMVSQINIADPYATEELVDLMYSSDFFLAFTFLYSLAFAIFLSAPIYRRLSDFNVKKTGAIWLTIIFVFGQVVSNLYLLDLSDDLYTTLSIFADLFSIASSVILILCIFKRSKN